MSLGPYNAQPNPFLGPAGTATMHGDAQASDCTPLAGPGAGPWEVTSIDMGGACPTILAGADGFIQVLTTQRFGKNATFLQPKVSILAPSGRILTSLEIPKGALLGAVYAYVDNENRLVVVDGSGTLLRLAHSADGQRLWVDERVDLSGFLAQEPGDKIVGLVPDWEGRVWVASQNARIAVVNTADRTITTVACRTFDPAERVDNSISASPRGVSVVTNRGIYLLTATTSARNRTGAPSIAWAHPYDAGSARKPGKLAWGSGASPTLFGPNGDDYVMLTDNNDRQESVIIYETSTGKEVGRAPLFTPGASATENSMIGIGNSVIGASTYGYPYPKYPEGAGPSVPRSALFAPGMERWDITSAGLTQVWSRPDLYSAAVPRYSTADAIIYTTQRPRGPAGLANGVTIDAVALDAATGATLHSQRLPGLVTLFGVDTLQMVGTFDSAGTWWQGTIGGIFRIARKGA